MAKVNPFRGVRYNPKAVPNAIDALAPPYDVISPEAQKSLYDRHDRNVVRLILGVIRDGDTDDNNRYTRSAKTLSSWLGDHTLIREDEPALYVYAQDYFIDGKKLQRVGFICRRLIEPLGQSIYPHERTLSGPKVDRLMLTRACKMNFSPVFGLYSDPERKVDGILKSIMNLVSADVDATDDEQVRHRMWILTDREAISEIQTLLENKPVVIADGHHRYETALNYRNERRAAENPKGPQNYDYALMYLSNSHGEGFTVLPTHRLVKEFATPGVDKILSLLGGLFTATQAPLDAQNMEPQVTALREAGLKAPSFIMIAEGKSYLLTLKKDIYQAQIGEGLSAALKMLDVTILQEVIFEKALGISREMVADKKVINYTIDPSEAARGVLEGPVKIAFLLNPTDVAKVIEVATAGGVMPQKSTYFYPKLISGLVFNPLE
ncbi:MAG: DUF1015 domain-containing protein [Nitrospinae bacterium]|nr:DUF1015 domain-containing protein [Nitrospinota bacterium]